jgi:outer membrane protein TolC
MLTMALSAVSLRSPVAFGQAATPQTTTTTQATTSELAPGPIEVAEKNGTALRLSLKDLTKLALQNNLDIAISDTNEELYQQRVLATYGVYDPQLIIGAGLASSKSPNTNLATRSVAGNFNKFDRGYVDLQWFQDIPTGGGFTVDYNSGRSTSNRAFDLFNPQYSANTLLSFTQPLWRNFRIDRNRNTIKLANLDLKVNDSQFKEKVVQTIARMQRLYWDLVAAIRDFEIRRESVKLAQIQLDNNKKKVEIGTLAPIGVTEARAEVSSREQEMIASEETIFTVQNDLRALISSDRSAPIWQQTIVPTDTPDFREVKVGLDFAIDTALKNRPEVEQLKITMEKNDLNYILDSNQRKWQLDLVGSFGTTGVAGPNIDPTRVDPTFQGGIGRSYQLLFSGGFFNWAAGVSLRIPLKNRALDSSLAQLKIEQRQNLMKRKVDEQKIIVEIRNAVQSLETNKKRVDTAKMARELSAEQLDGESKRFQAGLSENFLVLQRQRDLSSAQGVELRTLIDYKKSVIDLHAAMYTLLENTDFEIAKTSSDVALGNIPTEKRPRTFADRLFRLNPVARPTATPSFSLTPAPRSSGALSSSPVIKAENKPE